MVQRAHRPSDLTADIVRTILHTRFDDLSTQTIAHAKLRVLDIVGCIVGGSTASGTAELRDVLVARGGRRDASLLPSGPRVPVAAAAFANAVAARSNDFGVLIPYIGDVPVWSHISESTVPTALAVAEATGASGRDLLVALIVGDDLATRLAAGGRYVPGAGWDSPGLVNKFAVVAIAGRLMGVNASVLRDAFGLVLHQLGGTFQAVDSGAHAFKFAQGLAARDGIEAVELAAHGWTADGDPFFGRNGYADMYCDGIDLDVVAEGLGSVFHGDATFKPYPGCRFTHSTIDCALTLAPKISDPVQTVQHINLEVAPMHIGSPLDQPFAPGRYPQGHANFSLRFAAASTLLRGHAGLAAYVDQAITDPAVAALAERVTISGGRPAASPEAATMSVLLTDGTVLTASVETATGNPLSSPLDGDAIASKFRANCEHATGIGADRTERLLTLLERFEEIEDLHTITSV